MKGTTLVFGPGWLGTQFAERIEGAYLEQTDITDERALCEVLDARDPARVINCAGRTGRPNVDSLEAEPGRTLRSNVAGPILLAAACESRGIHLTHLGSGCVYSGDKDGAGYGEEDPPNFDGSLYARSKIQAEQALQEMGALQLRVRLPISAVPGPRNLLTKLLGYADVVRVANSITVLDDFWAPACALIEREETGIWNCVNPGVEYHDELLALYAERVDPTHAFQVISPDTLDGRLAARRSNCVLRTDKLAAAGLSLPPLDESLPRLVDAYGAHLHAAKERSAG